MILLTACRREEKHFPIHDVPASKSVDSDSIVVAPPFAISVTATYDEGHRSWHTRLHPNDKSVHVYQWSYPDSPQPQDSIKPSKFYGGHGGDQTMQQLRIRWARDVLFTPIDSLCRK